MILSFLPLLKKRIQNENNYHLKVYLFTMLFSIRAIFLIAFLFILNINIIIASDIEIKNSFNYQCLWVVRDALKSQQSIDELVNFASEKNINDLFVQVRGRGDA